MSSCRRPRLTALACCIYLLALLLVGCDASVLRPTQASTPTAFVIGPTTTPTPVVAPSLTSIEIVRYSAFPQNHVAPFSKRVNNPTAAQQLYFTALTLPLYSHPLHCPQDLGLAYRITLLDGERVRFQGMLSGGCPLLQISSPPAFRCRAADALVDELPAALGMTNKDLYDVTYSARSGAPVAPTPAEGYC